MTTAESIINTIAGQAQTSPVRFLRCPLCQHIIEHDASQLPPASCPACQSKTVFKYHATREQAQAAMNPVQAPPMSVPATTPIQPTPKARAKRPEPVQAPVVAPVVTGPVDPKAERKARIDKFIAENKLNCMAFTPVGYGRIYSIGFTRWTDSKPVYSLMEPMLDPTGQDLRAALAEAKKTDSTVKIDVAQVTELGELADVAWQGTVMASIWDAKTGPVRCKLGDRVELACRVSKQGGLIWQVVGVSK